MVGRGRERSCLVRERTESDTDGYDSVGEEGRDLLTTRGADVCGWNGDGVTYRSPD